MSLCQEFGHWVEDQVITPVEQFFTNAHQVCTEAREWVTREIRTPLETWVSQEEKRCREQECNWWCLCCNKWFCWIVVVLVKVIVWVVQVVGEWLVETICHLIVEVIRIIVMAIITLLRWVVELVVCFVEKFCQILILAAAVAIAAAVLALITASVGLPLLAALPAMLPGLGIGVIALLAARVLCELSICRLLGVFVWALKWSIVLGFTFAALSRSVGAAFVVILCGGVASALIWQMTARGCVVPRLLGPP